MKPPRRVNATIVYGPVRSRRFGISLGINLSGPGKYCSFNCPYCFRGPNEGALSSQEFRRTLPAAREVLLALDAWLAGPATEVEDWTIAGNAEPTDNPDFPEVVDGMVHLRNSRCPAVRITVLTNGMGLVARHNPAAAHVRAALAQVDCACLKLDSACPETWGRLARPAAHVTPAEWMHAASVLSTGNLSLQTMLVQGSLDNTTPSELDALRSAYQRIRPRQVYLMTLDKPPADTRILPVPADRMIEIARQLDVTLVTRHGPTKAGCRD